MMKGGGQQSSCKTLIGVHLAMHLMSSAFYSHDILNTAGLHNVHTHTHTTHTLHACVHKQEKVGDTLAQSIDNSSPTKGEDSHPASPAAKSPQNKLPPPKPEPLAAASDQEAGEGGEGIQCVLANAVLYNYSLL